MARQSGGRSTSAGISRHETSSFTRSVANALTPAKASPEWPVHVRTMRPRNAGSTRGSIIDSTYAILRKNEEIHVADAAVGIGPSYWISELSDGADPGSAVARRGRPLA